MKLSLAYKVILSLALIALFPGCSFDYGDIETENEDQPDIIMGEVEYVRVRDGDPVVRFRAQLAERYEKRQTMELQNFSFEQFYNHGDDVNATGRAGNALVELESGNILLENGIIISVESEDITIETENLSWEDEPRLLTGREEDTVGIQRSDGTLFSGKGFSANVRSRTWSFSGSVEGTFVDKDEEEDSSGELTEAADEEIAPENGEPENYPEAGEPPAPTMPPPTMIPPSAPMIPPTMTPTPPSPPPMIQNPVSHPTENKPLSSSVAGFSPELAPSDSITGVENKSREGRAIRLSPVSGIPPRSRPAGADGGEFYRLGGGADCPPLPVSDPVHLLFASEPGSQQCS